MLTKSLDPNDPCASFDLQNITLSKGGHGSTFKGECCLIEAANRATVCCAMLGRKFGVAQSFTDDHPSISPVVRAFGIAANDCATDEQRQRLVPYVKKVLGTKTSYADEQRRGWMATDWLVRMHTPAFLRLAGLTFHAQALEGLARIVDATTARLGQATLDAARSAADSAARSAADSAAYSAAYSAARSAADSAIQPTVDMLFTSALVLFDELIAVGK
jgi:hypothetical protein